MKAIIFGVSGQDGFYLSALLKELNYEVIGVSRHSGLFKLDIADYTSVSELVKNHQPEFIFHLAANSTTSHEALFENHATIATGTLNILESVKKYSPYSKVFISGSGLQFKNEGVPISETDPFEARDAYSISRIQSVYAARYFRSLGIRSYVGYFFNHESPLRTEKHMTQKIVLAARRIAAGSTEKLEIGDLTAIKEYTFAGDVVKGIWQFISQDEITEANISSGIGYSMDEWLAQCFGLINRNWQEYVVEKPGFKAPYQRLVSNPSLIFSLGWKPAVQLPELAKMMMQL